MPHSPSNEYLDDIYKLKTDFLKDMKNDSEFSTYCKKDGLDKNGWIDLYALALNKIKNYIDIESCLWSDFDWLFTELVEESLEYAANNLDKKIRISLYGLYRRKKNEILIETYYGDVCSFLQRYIDKSLCETSVQKSDDQNQQ